VTRRFPPPWSIEEMGDLPCDSEATIRERLLAIVSYLSLVQEK
jgi:hypothetical protein